MSELQLGTAFDAPTQDDWLAAVEAALRGQSADTLVSEDLAGFSRQPLYRDSETESGLPGFAPFTRGVLAVNDKFMPWQIAQRAVIGRKGVDNQALLTDLRGGVSALLLDLSADDKALSGLNKLLNGVMLDIAPLSLVPGGHGIVAAAALVELLDAQQIAADAVGFVNLDPIGAQILYGDAGPQDDTALIALADKRPGLRLMTASGAAFHAKGASVPQELGWMLAALTDYLRRLEAVGMEPAAALGKITLTVSADVDMFATLAKIRAARLLFANIAAAIGCPDTPPQIHAETSLRAFADIDPWVNILRATAAALGAGIAGVDMMCVAPCTASSAADNVLTRRIARNTQIILQEESHIGHVADAAGGSWYVEQLTQQLAEAAWAEFQTIEAAGGLTKAMADGTIDAALQSQIASYQSAVDKRAMPLVGVSEFPNLEEAPLEAGQNNTYRHAQGFETLRNAAQKAKPKVFMACIGEMADFTPRVNFAANLYAAGGLHAVNGEGATDAQEIAAAFQKSNAKIAVICGSDTAYDAHADTVARALKQAGVTHLALAGKPRDNNDIEAYCFAGCTALSFLTDIHATLGL